MQFKEKINVIIGNPSYSRGQKNENDNNQNTKYPELDSKIADTYVKDSKSVNKNSLYDSYIKALRWATDRLGNKGIISFISGSSILEKHSNDGLRKHLAQDFTSLYFINLRGDSRKNRLSNGKAQEGGNIFAQGCQTGICISTLIKNPETKSGGKIYYYDIGDDLTTKQKKQKIAELNILKDITWQEITPNDKYEWLNQRDDNKAIYKKFSNYLPIKEKSNKAVFLISSRGIATSRDAWVYNFSSHKLAINVQNSMEFYNNELKRYQQNPKNFLFTNDSSKISWSKFLKDGLKRNKKAIFDSKKIVTSLYLPFTTQYLYYDKLFNESLYQIPKIFPTGAEDNKVIIINGLGSRSSFSVLMSDKIPNLQILGNCQCFPLYLYDTSNYSLAYDSKAQKSYAIKDEIVKQFQQNLQHKISHEDLFYYIYGILHSTCYRATFAAVLKKELPRIPFAQDDAQFQAFNHAGRELAELHLSFEDGELYSEAKLWLNGTEITLDELKLQPSKLFYVTKMNFAKHPINKEKDLTAVEYNKCIKITNIPLEAYNYRICSVPAIEWVMRRQTVKTDKKSNITNDANDYAIETMQNPAYPLELLLRVINISVKSLKLIETLPNII